MNHTGFSPGVVDGCKDALVDLVNNFSNSDTAPQQHQQFVLEVMRQPEQG